jgi:hypothetical protein
MMKPIEGRGAPNHRGAFYSLRSSGISVGCFITRNRHGCRMIRGRGRGRNRNQTDNIGWRTHALFACVRILREDLSHTFRRGGRCVRHPRLGAQSESNPLTIASGESIPIPIPTPTLINRERRTTRVGTQISIPDQQRETLDQGTPEISFSSWQISSG